MKHFLRVVFILSPLIFTPMCQAITEYIETPPHPKIGNFANDITPGNTFCFGQLIAAKNTVIFYPILSQVTGDGISSICIAPSLIYGITDTFSLYTGLPIILKEKSDCCTQRGIGNIFAQLEYAYYTGADALYEDYGTILGNVEFPTTHLSARDSVQTCSNASKSAAANFFIGTTISHLSVDQYYYASLGANFYLKRDDVKQGTDIVYQWCVGHNLGTQLGMTTLGVLEFNGTYSQKTTDKGCKDPDSGGNVIYAGPSLCLCNTSWYISGGIQLPVLQKLNGTQSKEKFRSSVIVSITF